MFYEGKDTEHCWDHMIYPEANTPPTKTDAMVCGYKFVPDDDFSDHPIKTNGTKSALLRFISSAKERIIRSIQYLKCWIRMRKNTIIMYDPSGHKRKCRVIMEVYGDDHICIIYSNGTRDKDGNVVLYPAMIGQDSSGRVQVIPALGRDHSTLEYLIEEIQNKAGEEMKRMRFL